MTEGTVEDKVAQMIQPDIGSVTTDEVRRYRFGSILNGGNSAPYKNETGPASDYLKLADEMWDAAMAPVPGKRPIPMLWGTDAVHGHSNVVGATLFPHNIGLGAMRNPDLIRRIGEITALEVAVTGIDWTFAPTLAVVRDDRWGRSYEGYSEDPGIVRAYAGAMTEGLQGRAGTAAFLGGGKVIATAKHFVGDGGTLGGKDQGDNLSSPEQLRDIHGAGYPPAIAAGVQTVMASYSSVRGRKMHGHRELLTDALKGDMGFDGLVVGDWNGHGQVPGCTNTSCAQAINAGIDMFMPAARLGLGYRYSAMKNLVDLVGPGAAKDLFFTARRLDASEAKAIGLVSRTCAPEALDALLADYSGAMADNAPLTVMAGKAIMREILKPSPELDMDLCTSLIRGCFESADYTEGRTAFMQKRKPVFTGR